MDKTELTLRVLSIIGGALIFVSAIISFINSRLNEAKTPQGRTNVVAWTLFAVGWVVSVGFILSALIFYLPLLAIPSYLLAGVLQISVFLSRSGRIDRGEVVWLSVIIALSLSFSTAMLSIDLINRIINENGHMLDLIERIIKSL